MESIGVRFARSIIDPCALREVQPGTFILQLGKNGRFMSEETLRKAYEILSARINTPISQSKWFEITQDRINEFADVTMDHQWIHVDEERAGKGPYGGTIAHGHLTLAMMGQLPIEEDATESLPKLEGQKQRVNYGFDRVRFPSPVPSGAMIRRTTTLRRVEIKGGMIETMNEVVVEIQGQEKPACVAESLGRIVF